MVIKIKILLCLLLSLFSLTFKLNAQENISIKNINDKTLFVPLIDSQEVFLIEFEIDTFGPRIPFWQKTINSDQSCTPGELHSLERRLELGMITKEQYNKIKKQREEFEKRRNTILNKEREVVKFKKNFDVMYIRGEMYFLRIFYEELTETEFKKITTNNDLIFTDLMHALDYDEFVEYSTGIEFKDSLLQNKSNSFIRENSLTNEFIILQYPDDKRYYKILYFDVLFINDNSTHNFIRRYDHVKSRFTKQFGINPTEPDVNWPDKHHSIYFNYFHEAVNGQVAPFKPVISLPSSFPDMNYVTYKVVEVDENDCFVEYIYETPDMQYFYISKISYSIQYWSPLYWDFKSFNRIQFNSSTNDTSNFPLFRYRYIPDIAYYPDMFTLKSINGKSVKEFSQLHCDRSINTFDPAMNLTKGSYYFTIKPYNNPEHSPVFPGGRDAFIKYINDVSYPSDAVDKQLEGLTIIGIVIDIQGRVTELELVSSSGHEILDRAAIEHVRNMPEFSPGIHDGKKVPVKTNIAVKFSLGNLHLQKNEKY